MKVRNIFSKNSRFAKTIYTAKYSLKYVAGTKKGKLLILSKASESIVMAALTAVSIIVPGLLINKLLEQSYDAKLVWILAAVLLTPFLQVLVSLMFERIIAKLNQTINIEISNDYFRRISAMDYENLENPDIQLLQERAESTLNGITGAVDMLSSLIYAVCSLFAVASIIAVLHPLVIALICIVIVYNSYNTNKANTKLYEGTKELNKMYLLQSVFPFMLTHMEYAKEMRLYNVSEYLIGKLSSATKETNKKEIKQLGIRQRLRFDSGVMFLLQQVLIYSYLVYLVIAKSLQVGTMTIYLNATAQFGAAVGRVTEAYLTLANKSMYVEDMIAFFNLPQKCSRGDISDIHFSKGNKIVFRDVGFQYPGSTNYALKGVNLTIDYGEKLCIVGENGSGKSTLIKLLCRLYEPTEGSITIDGTNISDMDYKTYQKMFSVVFQDFATFSLSLSENIVLGDTLDCDLLDDKINKAGLKKLTDKLENGYDTCLDKDIDEHGIHLSGGEAQKMAIARALYHGGEIYILDEPTAALDPNAEYEIYTQFHNMIQGKTAIMITHRLSAVQLADKVAVLDGGEIVEYGTHAELYAKGGKYTEMFDKQAQFYRDAPAESAEAG